MIQVGYFQQGDHRHVDILMLLKFYPDKEFQSGKVLLG